VAQFSIEQYHRMIRSGAFTEENPVELIDGWVVKKMPKGPEHEYAVGETQEQLQRHLPSSWHLRNQAPITLATSEPEPDLTVARGGRGNYRDRHPYPTDIALLVEISDTTLDIDRLKGATYGAAGIPAYWIVNLPERCVEVYSHPTSNDSSGYLVREVFYEGDHVRLIIDDQDYGEIPVAAILP
jgi:Uma2 family endonuclease